MFLVLGRPSVQQEGPESLHSRREFGMSGLASRVTAAAKDLGTTTHYPRLKVPRDRGIQRALQKPLEAPAQEQR
jgi:hypothetical protein